MEYIDLGSSAVDVQRLSKQDKEKVYISTLKMETVCSSETLVDMYRTTRRHIPVVIYISHCGRYRKEHGTEALWFQTFGIRRAVSRS
jgi:hypothetical protein